MGQIEAQTGGALEVGMLLVAINGIDVSNWTFLKILETLKKSTGDFSRRNLVFAEPLISRNALKRTGKAEVAKSRSVPDNELMRMNLNMAYSDIENRVYENIVSVKCWPSQSVKGAGPLGFILKPSKTMMLGTSTNEATQIAIPSIGAVVKGFGRPTADCLKSGLIPQFVKGGGPVKKNMVLLSIDDLNCEKMNYFDIVLRLSAAHHEKDTLETRNRVLAGEPTEDNHYWTLRFGEIMHSDQPSAEEGDWRDQLFETTSDDDKDFSPSSKFKGKNGGTVNKVGNDESWSASDEVGEVPDSDHESTEHSWESSDFEVEEFKHGGKNFLLDRKTGAVYDDHGPHVEMAVGDDDRVGIWQDGTIKFFKTIGDKVKLSSVFMDGKSNKRPTPPPKPSEDGVEENEYSYYEYSYSDSENARAFKHNSYA
jgi:hypothetical protein